MLEKKQASVPMRTARDPFAMFRELAASFDRAFGEWPLAGPRNLLPNEPTIWSPRIDVFERDQRLVTRVDLPGMKKDDLTVEVTDGHLALPGQRKRETEEKKDNIYRSEREYGDFYRLVPLPDGVTLADVKATFADGVLEVSVPLPTRVENTVRKVPIDDVKPAAKSAA